MATRALKLRTGENMLIRLGYEIGIGVSSPTTVVGVLSVHPTRNADLLVPDTVRVIPDVPTEEYIDGFGNRCTRLIVPQGGATLWGSTVIRDSGEPDAVDWSAAQVPAEKLPPETLQFLLASRYCEVDRLSDMAWQLFGNLEPGWPRVQGICDWVHANVHFDYGAARPTKSALDVTLERQGVCRDFQHLAITFCRCMHIPARYATGYLGDIGVPPAPCPMDFSAWFEVFLGGRWWTCDARHNRPRIGRVLMAIGRDAADVALTTSFGACTLTGFSVVTEEISDHDVRYARINEVYCETASRYGDFFPVLTSSPGK
jgi:transglutaminase-like putative cysteine protease